MNYFPQDKILTYLLEHQCATAAEMARFFKEKETKPINQCLFYELEKDGLAVQVSKQKGWKLTHEGVKATIL